MRKCDLMHLYKPGLSDTTNKAVLEKATASNSLAYCNIADETFSTQPSDLSDFFLATCLINEINSSLFRLHRG